MVYENIPNSKKHANGNRLKQHTIRNPRHTTALYPRVHWANRGPRLRHECYKRHWKHRIYAFAVRLVPFKSNECHALVLRHGRIKSRICWALPLQTKWPCACASNFSHGCFSPSSHFTSAISCTFWNQSAHHIGLSKWILSWLGLFSTDNGNARGTFAPLPGS